MHNKHLLTYFKSNFSNLQKINKQNIRKQTININRKYKHVYQNKLLHKTLSNFSFVYILWTTNHICCIAYQITNKQNSMQNKHILTYLESNISYLKKKIKKTYTCKQRTLIENINIYIKIN